MAKACCGGEVNSAFCPRCGKRIDKNGFIGWGLRTLESEVEAVRFELAKVDGMAERLRDKLRDLNSARDYAVKHQIVSGLPSIDRRQAEA